MCSIWCADFWPWHIYIYMYVYLFMFFYLFIYLFISYWLRGACVISVKRELERVIHVMYCWSFNGLVGNFAGNHDTAAVSQLRQWHFFLGETNLTWMMIHKTQRKYICKHKDGSPATNLDAQTPTPTLGPSVFAGSVHHLSPQLFLERSTEVSRI